jgi:putative tricarboxylic transport membrane protein
MTPIWMRTTHRAVEIGLAIVLLILGVVILYEAVGLGPTWGESGPQAGFFLFVLSLAMIVGTLGVAYVNAYRYPDTRPFFEAPEEVEDLLKVGLPIVALVLLIPLLGMYASAGLYLAFFMAWYGKFRWYSALTGGIILPVVLWIMLREGFNISMPMSAFYRSNILPF